MFSKIRYNRAIVYSTIGAFALLATLALLLPGARLIIAFFLYTATLNSGLIPFPTMTAVIFLGKNYSPLLVAVVGTAGSAVASIIVYYLMTKLSKKESLRKIENSRIIRNWKTLTSKSPFLSLILFNAIPLPIEPSRFFAIFNGYSVIKYAAAISMGRFVRYFLLAALGGTFQIPNGVLIVLTIALIAVPLLVKQAKKFLQHLPKIRMRESLNFGSVKGINN